MHLYKAIMLEFISFIHVPDKELHVCVKKKNNCNKKFEVNYSSFLMLKVGSFTHFECLNLIFSPPKSQPFSIFN